MRVAAMKQQSPDAVVCLGDIVMRCPQPAECVQMLRSLRPLAVVRGNFDDVFVRYLYALRHAAYPYDGLVKA